MKQYIRNFSFVLFITATIATSFSLSAQPLSGTYTIGGTTPNYATFNTAVSALATNGVSGPVVFNVRNGIYIEQLSISAITGASATNTITFQSQSGDSTSATLTFSPSSTSNYTVRFNGSDYIYFRKLNIKATGASYATVFRFELGSNYNHLENNLIEGNVTTSASSNQAVIYGAATTLSDNYFVNNAIKDGSIGIYLSSATSNIQITQNIFQNQYYRALDITSVTNLLVSKNSIQSSTTNPSYEGMMLSGCGNYLQITKNKLYLSNGNYAIDLYNCIASNATRGLIANNFISINGSANTVYGIYTYNCTYQNIYFNTVNNNRPYTGTYTMYTTGSSSNNIQIQNNIFSNKGGGYAIWTDYSSIINICDYNDLYSNGSYLAYWAGYNCGSLAIWRSYSSLDVHSVSVLPEFPSLSDLHTQVYLLDNFGYPVSGVTDDIDGQSRSFSTPDMGADEWSTPTNDAGVTSIDQTLTYCMTNDSVFATIKNYGTANLTAVSVNWKVNGVTQTPKSWTGNLAQGSSFGPFSLGRYSFGLGTSYSIYAWTTNPNGSTEGLSYNDTCTAVNKYKAMSGSYTIGGTTPNYATFNAALTDLINGGICGPVAFNVRNGVYNEQISIPQIAGSSAVNTITFQSQTGDSTQVILTNAPTSSYNYTVQFNGCDYVTFRKMKLIATGTTYATVFRIESNSVANKIERCLLQGLNTTTNSSNLAVIYGVASGLTNTVITLNKISDGSIGIYISGSSSGLQIIQNIFQNQNYRGMDLTSLSQLIISKNILNSSNTNYSYEGMYLYLCGSGLQITKNKLNCPFGYYGINMYNCTATSSTRGLIANNFIGMSGDYSSAYGIYAYNCSYQNFYYNSVNISRPYSGTYAMYITGSSSSNIQLQNNVFSNKGGGYAIWSDYSSVISASDYNDLYSNGSYVAYWYGYSCTTLSTWRSYTGLDVHSISASPDFLSSTDLHIQSYLLDNLGYPVTGISDDIDAQTRSLSTPDMGADEWTTPANDAGATSIDQPLTYCMTNDSVYANIKNYGSANLTAVTVNWKVNGVTQTPKSWTGNLAQGSSFGPFSLGKYSFNLGTSYSIYAWTTNPNGSSEGFTFNDTCPVVNKYKAMSGTFTIGGTTPNYATFNAAITDLINGGVCGPVIFNVRNGTYNEQVSIPNINGVSAVNSITFQSQTGDSTQVILTYAPTSSYNYTVQFNGCDYVTFRKMKLIATGTTYATVFRIESNSVANKIERCLLQGLNTTSTNANLAVIYGVASGLTNTIITLNKISDGSIGIYISGSSSGLQIIQNIFQNQNYRGMDLTSLSQLIISKNILNSSSTYYGYEGMYLYLCGSGLQITKNKLNCPFGYYGINMYSCTATSSTRGLIANNFISMSGNGNTAYGIYAYSCTYQNFYYNSVSISRPYSGTYALYISGSSSSNIQLQNNIFSNEGGGYAIWSDYSSVISASDYNDLYSNGSYVAYWYGYSCTTLSTWRSYTGLDVHSISARPEFLSATDLHIQAYLLDNLGYPVTGITDDIDAQTRSLSTPDMGADEWTTPTNDAGATSIDQTLTYCMTNDSIYANIKNYGSTNLTAVTVNWKVNGVTQTPKSWTGNLAQGSSFGPFSLGRYSFSLGTSYSIYAWTTNPNGATEGFTFNDTCPVVNKYKAMSGTFTIGGTSPSYATFNAAVTDLINGGVCGPVVFNVRNGTYNEQFTIPNITGTSASNSITFQSETGDSNLVTLTYAPTSSYNYTVQFNGCDYVTFRKMKIIASGTTYAVVFRIESNSVYNKIERCLLQGLNTTSTSSNLAVIYGIASGLTNTIISLNKISNGSIGIYINGSSSGLQITQNTLLNQYYRAMDLGSLSQLNILKNTISSNTVHYGFEGIYLYLCGSGLQIIKNKLNIVNGYYGIDMNNCTASSTTRGLIANNFISINGDPTTAYGIYIYNCNYQNFYYNTVNVNRNYSGTYSLYVSGSSSTNIQLQNNVISNKGTGYAVWTDYSGNINISDYNDLYSNGSYVAYWYGNYCNTIAMWRSYTGLDVHSVSVMPDFKSVSDLHLQSYQLDNLGYPVTGVADDMDGQARSLSTPDLGADEWTTPTNDAGATSIDQALTYCITNDSVYASIKNYGTTNLTSVSVNWKVNGVTQTPKSWSGNLAQGSSFGPFSLGRYVFSLGTAYSIYAWTTNPNGATEGFTYNDTCPSVSKYKAMSGTYTIGGTSPNYANFNAAVTDLVNGGICGSVVFNVRNGVYNEQVSIPQIAGTSASNTITFQSQTGDSTQVVMTFAPTSASNYTVQFNGCDYVTFRKMKIIATGITYATAIRIESNSNAFKIERCLIQGWNTTSTSSNLATIFCVASGITNSIFTSNNIYDGSMGLYINGSSSSVQITQNLFQNQYYRAMDLSSLSQLLISKNTITSNTVYNSYEGMYLYLCGSGLQITKNKVVILNGTYAINLYNCTASSSSRGLIANNFVSINGNTSTGYGMYLYNCTYQNLYYNSVNVNRQYSNTYSLYVSGSSSSNIQLQNNIFSNKGGGYTIWADYYSSINVSDYNDLFSNGSYIAYWYGNYCTALSNWRSFTGLDVHSVSVLPDFISATDLHLQAYLLDNLGYPVAGVTDDMDAQARSLSTPDMGADEWTTAINDAGVTSIDQALTYCITNDSVYATIKNYGTTNLTSVTVNWKVNGVTQTPKSWTGNLAQANSFGPFSLGKYVFSLGTPYTIFAWTTNPNGSPEVFTFNDSSAPVTKYKALSGTYTIGGTSPDYANFTAAVTDLANGGICGSVIFNVRNGTYNEQISIPNISGTSITNTVTFQSQTGDSNLVILTYGPIVSYNYTVQLNGCDYVTFRKMKVIATGTTYATVFRIETNSIGNRIDRCLLQGWNTTSSSANLAVIYCSASYISNNIISQNKITDGSIGIYIYGGGSTGVQIIQNNLLNQYYRAMDLSSFSQLIVSRNQISSNSTYNSYEGIYLYQSGNYLQLTKNKINLLTGYYGINMNSCTASSSSRGLIANNFVTITGAGSTSYGFYNYNNTYQSYYYNDVNITRSSTNTYCFSISGSSSSNFQLQNNIFTNTGGGYAIWADYSGVINVSDYNNLYTNGTYLAYWYGTYCGALSNWRTSTAQDVHSFSVLPVYVSSTDLHTCNSTLNNAAIPVSAVTDDIDGQSRSILTPDIGADEYGGTPTVSLGPDRATCSSTTIDAGNVGAAYLWSTSATTQTITVSTPGTYWVQVTNACGSGYDTIVISNTPTTPGTITGSASVCPNQSGLTYSITAVSGAVSYNWTVPSGWTITAGQSSNSITVTSATNSGNVCVTAASGCASSSPSCKGLTVLNSISAPGSITGNTSVCSGSTNLNYTISSVSSATSYTWTVPSGWTITSGQGSTSLYATAGTAGGNICVTASNSCSSSSATCQAVNILGVPSAPGSITGSTSVCSGKSGLTYSISPVSGSVAYKWTVPSGWTITAGQGTVSITVSSGTTGGNICVSDSNGCLSSSASCQAIGISGAPSAPGAITGSTSVCSGKTGLTYSVAPVSGALGYKWTVPSGWTITLGQGTNSITVTSGTTGGNICVIDTNACLSSSSSCQSVSILGAPSAPGAITGPLVVCANKSGLGYSISPVSGSVAYTWTVPKGWTISSGQGTTAITVTSDTSGGNVCVTDSNGCTSSSASCKAVSVLGVPPTPGAITGSTIVCANQTNINYSVSLVSGAIGYIWSVPTGWTIKSGQGTNAILVTSGTTSGNICVIDTNSCFRSAANCQFVSIQSSLSTPAAITGSTFVCPNQSGIGYSISPVSGATSYNWTVPTGWSISSGQGSTSITVFADTTGGDICVKASNACVVSSQRCLSVSVKAAPPKAGPITGQNLVCSNTTGISYSTTAISGVLSYKWVLPSGWVITSGHGTTSITVTSGTSGGDICVSDSNSCGTGLASCLTVNITPKPATPGTISGQLSVCANQSGLTYSVPAASGATSYTWTVPTAWTIVSGQGTTSITVTSGTASGNICVTSINSCAQSTPSCVAVTALSLPLKPGVVSGLNSACAGQTAMVFSISSVADATSYIWTVPLGWTIVSGQGSTILTVNSGSVSGDICVSSANSCGSSTASCMKVNILSIPQTPSILFGRDSICENSTGLLYYIDPVLTANSYFWTIPAGWSIISGQGTDSIVVNPGTSNGSIGVVATNSCGSSNQISKMVMIFPLPSKPTITQNVKILTSSSNTGNQWYENGVLIPAATGKQYQPPKSGWYTVLVTNNEGCSTLSSAYYFYTTSGINESVKISVKLYPNPSDGRVNLTFTGCDSKMVDIRINDLLGRTVYVKRIKVEKDIVEFNTGLASGLYSVVISMGDDVIVKQMVVK